MRMQALTLLLLLGTAMSMPPQHNSKEQDEEESTVMIVGCLAENWRDTDTESENLARVGTCLKCIEQAGDPLSADGLPKIKSCVATYMPIINQACAKEIANVTVEGEESGVAAIDCFEDTLDDMGADWCLKKATAALIVDRMTEAVGCVLETHKNVTDFVMAVKSKEKGELANHGGEENGQSMHGGMHNGMNNGKIMQLVMMAHCDVAADGNVTRSKECQQCFDEGLQKDGADGGHLAAHMAACSHSFLLPFYQDCQPSLDSLVHVDPTQAKHKSGEVIKCYTGKLLRYVVSGCVTPTMEPTPENLETVMTCSKLHIKQWAMNAAGPELAAVLKNHLPEDSSEEKV